MYPPFQEQGLSLFEMSHLISTPLFVDPRTNEASYQWKAVMVFFDLTYVQSKWLFSHQDYLDSRIYCPNAKDVADRIRATIAGHANLTSSQEGESV